MLTSFEGSAGKKPHNKDMRDQKYVESLSLFLDLSIDLKLQKLFLLNTLKRADSG